MRMDEKGADKTIVEWILKWQPLIEDSSSTLGSVGVQAKTAVGPASCEGVPMQSAYCCADTEQTGLQDTNHDNLNWKCGVGLRVADRV